MQLLKPSSPEARKAFCLQTPSRSLCRGGALSAHSSCPCGSWEIELEVTMECAIWGWLGHLHGADLPVQNQLLPPRAAVRSSAGNSRLSAARTCQTTSHLRRAKGVFSPCVRLGWEFACVKRSNSLKFGAESLCVLPDTRSFTGSQALLAAMPIPLK